jgi:hypothetical protein
MQARAPRPMAFNACRQARNRVAPAV